MVHGPTRVRPKTASGSVQLFFFCTVHHYDQHTGTQTTLRATSVAKGRIYAMHAMLRKSRAEATKALTDLVGGNGDVDGLADSDLVLRSH